MAEVVKEGAGLTALPSEVRFPYIPISTWFTRLIMCRGFRSAT